MAEKVVRNTMQESSSTTDVVSSLKLLVSDQLKKVDKIIVSTAESKNSELVPEITKYLNESGGKRLRPLLTLVFSLLSSNKKDNAIYLAAAVELIHAATLLHDDVVDGSDTRRGRKTTNNVWGNKIAILVGDYLFSQSFILMVKTSNLDALDLLSRTSAIIAEAEVKQIEIINNLDLSTDGYIKLISAKTAVLFAAACRCGVIEEQNSLQNSAYQYGMNLGIVYQLVDDTLDYFATDQKFGKNIGNDLKEKKITLPLLLLLERSLESRSFVEELFEKESISDEEVEKTIEIMHLYNIPKACFEFTSKHSKIACEALSEIRKLNPDLCKILVLLVENLRNRSH